MDRNKALYDAESVKMKAIGLIGGISYQSTIEYYRIINDEINRIYGGHHFAKCLIYSLDLEPVLYYQETGDWAGLAAIVTNAAESLKRAGAEIIVICSNTTNRIAGFVQEQINMPLLHIADATAYQIRDKGLKTVALLGTRFTMEEDFYKDRLKGFAIDTLIPEKEDRKTVHQIIYNELDYGIINHDSRLKYLKIIDKLAQKGAEGVILGCTEIPLLIKQKDCPIPVFDTTAIHAVTAVEMALDVAE